jgi:hypothetical protein
MKQLLKDYDSQKVAIFCGYLNQLETELDKDKKPKNWWFKNVTKQQFADAFKKVYETGLFIDGDSVTINFRNKLVITYDYHAYKNKILFSYPDTIFDFGVVFAGDEFLFRKESGKVIYSHKINDPFKVGKDIVGAYGIIKNKRGEFLELLNMSDIAKMKNTSTMKNIWEAWFDRMVLKSVIKRICTIHFKDITKEIDIIDNETNEPERATIDELLLVDIDKAETNEQLSKIYNANIGIVADKEQFLKVLTTRKTKINGTLS